MNNVCYIVFIWWTVFIWYHANNVWDTVFIIDGFTMLDSVF